MKNIFCYYNDDEKNDDDDDNDNIKFSQLVILVNQHKLIIKINNI
jgi:hypothetical protein